MKRNLGLLLCLAVSLSACAASPLAVLGRAGAAGSPPGVPPPLPPIPPPAAGAVPLGADLVELLTDGAGAAARLVRAVAAARRTIHAEIYEFDRPDLLAAMLDARRRGVEVRAILDPTVRVDAPTEAALAAAGAEVSLFPDQARQIDHAKLLLVDGARAFFGGMNWGARSYLNHDFEVALTGPSVAALERLFATDRLRCGRLAGPPEPAPPPANVALRLLATYPDDTILPAVLAMIGSARRYLFVEMYVMTDAHVVSALAEAARRGLAVWCLLDPSQDPNRATIVALRLAGVHVAYYRTHGELLHAKAMVADGERLLVGSANWSRSGFTRNHELDAVLESAALAAAALARMEADWNASR